jgi:predicted transposase YdaD
VLEYWFFERFRDLSAKEIWTMLERLTPLQQTKAYQSIYAEGLADGETRGETRGKAATLNRRRFGQLPDWAARRIAEAEEVQLDAWLDGIFDADSVAALLGPEDRAD